MQTSDFFARSYTEARAKFHDAIKTKGVKIESHINPSRGPSGEELATAECGHDCPFAFCIGSSFQASLGQRTQFGHGPVAALRDRPCNRPCIFAACGARRIG